MILHFSPAFKSVLQDTEDSFADEILNLEGKETNSPFNYIDITDNPNELSVLYCKTLVNDPYTNNKRVRVSKIGRLFKEILSIGKQQVSADHKIEVFVHKIRNRGLRLLPGSENHSVSRGLLTLIPTIMFDKAEELYKSGILFNGTFGSIKDSYLGFKYTDNKNQIDYEFFLKRDSLEVYQLVISNFDQTYKKIEYLGPTRIKKIKDLYENNIFNFSQFKNFL
jgi:hypothetical protein